MDSVKKERRIEREARPLSHHLILLVVGVLLPMLCLTFITVGRFSNQEKEAAKRRITLSAEGLAASLDREFSNTTRALYALAQSERLENNDLTGFYVDAKRVVKTQSTWRLVILLTPDGRQVLNTGRPFGTSLSPVNDPESLAEIVATRQPVVGNFVLGQPGKVRAFPIRVPVVIDNELKFVLTAVLSSDAIQQIVTEQMSSSDEWTRTILDGRGTVVARTRSPERFVGTSATPSFIERMQKGRSGIHEDTTPDNERVYAGLAPSTLSSWTTAVIVPTKAIDGLVWNSLYWILAFGLAMLGLSILAALLLSRRIAASVASVARAAEVMAEGERPLVLPSSVREIERLGKAIHLSSELLSRREVELNDHLSRALEARTEAEAASKAKDHFLAMLAHELRNPLAPIRTGIHLLKRFLPDDEKTGSIAGTIERQVKHMTRLIDDLLDTARVTSGKIHLVREVIDLRKLVDQIVSDYRSQFEDIGIIFTTKLPEKPLFVFGDEVRLAQCIGNLLQNASKFTPQGMAASIALEHEGKYAKIIVHDSGSGIEKELLPKLFEPFMQAPQSTARSNGGLGLGLALVRGLVELHGGKVEAESEGLGKGATFTITLTAIADEPTCLIRPISMKPAATSQKRVLIVEDASDAALMLKLYLEGIGNECLVASSAEEALSNGVSFCPDVILCDIGLPDMDGYALCQKLKEFPELKDVPSIALTGYGQAEDITRAKLSGFDVHLTKPVDLDRLQIVLNELPLAESSKSIPLDRDEPTLI